MHHKLYIYAPIGADYTYLYYEPQDSPPENSILMESEKPEGNFIAAKDGTWQPVIDNSIFVTNGQARQQRIQREQQQKAKSDLQKLKQQVAAMAI